MTERIQAFGGEHTRRKLDVVAKYLAAYVTVTRHPVGTKFRIYAKETDREGSPPFLYTHFSWPYEVLD
jgi:hypothetical protein